MIDEMLDERLIFMTPKNGFGSKRNTTIEVFHRIKSIYSDL
jgi:hypothetical protein